MDNQWDSHSEFVLGLYRGLRSQSIDQLALFLCSTLEIFSRSGEKSIFLNRGRDVNLLMLVGEIDPDFLRVVGDKWFSSEVFLTVSREIVAYFFDISGLWASLLLLLSLMLLRWKEPTRLVFLDGIFTGVDSWWSFLAGSGLVTLTGGLCTIPFGVVHFSGVDPLHLAGIS